MSMFSRASILWFYILVAVVVAFVDGQAALAQSAYFTGLGFLPGDDLNGARSVSADGSTILGISYNSASPGHRMPFRWTRGTGMAGLGIPPGYTSILPTSISADGTAVVGWSGDGIKSEAFRWTKETGWVSLATIESFGANSYVHIAGITDDGSTIFGTNISGASGGMWSPFRWTQANGFELLSKVIGGASYDRVEITDVSKDGKTAIGRVNGFAVDGNNEVVRWTETGGFQAIAVGVATHVSPDGSIVGTQISAPGPGHLWSADRGLIQIDHPTSPPADVPFVNVVANNFTNDGKVAAGLVYSYRTNTYRAFRWTEGTGSLYLDPLSGGAIPEKTSGISADGSIFVGNAIGGTDSGAYFWDIFHGSRSLRQALIEDYGLEERLAGWKLEFAQFSADGRALFGGGINPSGKTESWVAFLGAPVPEPSAIVLTALALVPLARRRRRDVHRVRPPTASRGAAALLLALVAALVTADAVHAQQAFFMALDNARDVTADGSVLLTTGELWRRDTGVVPIDGLPFDHADQISADGSTILGRTTGVPGLYRWTRAEGAAEVPTSLHFAELSGDGTVVVGQVLDPPQGARWTPTGGIQRLFPGAAWGVSADGSVVLGGDGGGRSPFLWTASGIVRIAGPFVQHVYNGTISDDGKVVVGSIFRWTQTTGAVDFGRLPDGRLPGYPVDLSADGSRAVGSYNIGSPGSGFISDEAHGARYLANAFASDYGLGAQIAGWDLRDAYHISADGRTIIGFGRNPLGVGQTWVAFLGAPVPEPNSFLLAASAMAQFASRRRSVLRACTGRIPRLSSAAS